MGFYNEYPNRKDWRRQYPSENRQSLGIAHRNHGACDWCQKRRLHQYLLAEEASLAELKAYRDGLYSTHLYDPVDENEYNYFNDHISEYTPY